jgi:hypothetical protein
MEEAIEQPHWRLSTVVCRVRFTTPDMLKQLLDGSFDIKII